MRTRPERSFIEASIIGDSHSMAVWKHLAPKLNFRHTMSAPAKHFDGQFYTVEGDVLHISAEHLRDAFPRAKDDVIQTMANARARLDGQLQGLLEAKLPVVSSLGAASYRFARRVAATDPLSGQSYPAKMIRAAAGEHVAHFVGFHEELLKRVPSVAFIIGACRYPDEQKATWLAYDQVISDRLSALGATIIDVRAEVGDDDLRLLPEFQADDVLHGNEKWSDAVAKRIFDFLGFTPAPTRVRMH